MVPHQPSKVEGLDHGEDLYVSTTSEQQSIQVALLILKIFSNNTIVTRSNDYPHK